jgi:nucleoid-associated protein YgaU
VTATSMRRIIVSSLVLAALIAAIASGIAHMRRDAPVETAAATSVPADSPRSAATPDESAPAAVAALQAETAAVTEALVAPPPPPAQDIDGSVPAFDIARIEPTGDAVIAGTAAPGAIVELLRNGSPHAEAVADQSGQFVMIPPRLPPGDYALTLRSRLPNGKQATSKQSVTVALAMASDAAEPSSVGALSRADEQLKAPETVATNRAEPNQAEGSAQARLRSDGGSPSAVAGPKIATAVVSRGDSLWRISRLTYGAGTRYALVYKANRERIRNPDRIFPGQVFVLPPKRPEK